MCENHQDVFKICKMVFALSDVKNFRAIIIKTAGTGTEME